MGESERLRTRMSSDDMLAYCSWWERVLRGEVLRSLEDNEDVTVKVARKKVECREFRI